MQICAISLLTQIGVVLKCSNLLFSCDLYSCTHSNNLIFEENDSIHLNIKLNKETYKMFCKTTFLKTLKLSRSSSSLQEQNAGSCKEHYTNSSFQCTGHGFNSALS